MSTVVVVQARTGSRRLPGKVLEDVAGAPLIARVLERAARIPGADRVVLATTSADSDDRLADVGAGLGFEVVRGRVDDVLARFALAAERTDASVVVRVTGDCPLLDPAVSGSVLRAFATEGVSYASNIEPPTYPDGLDTEAFSRETLDIAHREARLASEREHVTPFIRSRPERFPRANVESAADLSALRWTVDEPSDLEFVRTIYRLAGDTDFGMDRVIAILEQHPELAGLNAGIVRNAGLLHSLQNDRIVGDATE